MGGSFKGAHMRNSSWKKEPSPESRIPSNSLMKQISREECVGSLPTRAGVDQEESQNAGKEEKKQVPQRGIVLAPVNSFNPSLHIDSGNPLWIVVHKLLKGSSR